jgi:hypothetical protein
MEIKEIYHGAGFVIFEGNRPYTKKFEEKN